MDFEKWKTPRVPENPLKMAYIFFNECRFQKGFHNNIINFNADVNECDVDNGGCSQRCTNTEGSFNCGCTDGYMLDVIGKICIGTYWVTI